MQVKISQHRKDDGQETQNVLHKTTKRRRARPVLRHLPVDPGGPSMTLGLWTTTWDQRENGPWLPDFICYIILWFEFWYQNPSCDIVYPLTVTEIHYSKFPTHLCFTSPLLYSLLSSSSGTVSWLLRKMCSSLAYALKPFYVLKLVPCLRSPSPGGQSSFSMLSVFYLLLSLSVVWRLSYLT